MSTEKDEQRRAGARLQGKFLREIPLTRHLGLRVDGYDGRELVVSAPLGPNVNDKGTAFAGSLNALMTLAGWGLVYLRLSEIGENCDIVIHKGELLYSAPIRSPFQAVATLSEEDWEACLKRLQSRGRGRILVATRVDAAGETAATLDGQYVAMRRS